MSIIGFQNEGILQKIIFQGQRYKLSYDGMYHFDIPKSRQYDTGKIEVIARNSAGEAITSTELEVISRKDDYRAVLKNSPRRKLLFIVTKHVLKQARNAFKRTP